MDFSIALAHLLEGRPIKRRDWTGHLEYRDGKIFYVWPSGAQMTWVPPQGCILARDWELWNG